MVMTCAVSQASRAPKASPQGGTVKVVAEAKKGLGEFLNLINNADTQHEEPSIQGSTAEQLFNMNISSMYYTVKLRVCRPISSEGQR